MEITELGVCIFVNIAVTILLLKKHNIFLGDFCGTVQLKGSINKTKSLRKYVSIYFVQKAKLISLKHKKMQYSKSKKVLKRLKYLYSLCKTC